MNLETLNTQEYNSNKQKILDAYSKIVKFLHGFESNAPIGRVDDQGNYDAEYYDVKDSQDQINDIMQAVKNMINSVNSKDDYLKKVCKKTQLYHGSIPKALLDFIKDEFGVEVVARTNDEIKKNEYESRIRLVPLMYFVSLEQVKKLIPYEEYCEKNMTNDDIYRIISAKFRERSDA